MTSSPTAAARPGRSRLRMIAGVFTAAGLLTTGALTASPAAAAAAGCSSNVPGDVNGDKHAEVAVGEPWRAGKGGGVHIFYGRSSGLATKAAGKALNDQYLTQDTAGVPDSSESGDDFGAKSAFGDFDDDGCADIVVSAAGENSGDGSITVLKGSRKGITTTGAKAYSTESLFGAGSFNERFGGSLAVGDFNDDGFDDVAAGAPGRNVSDTETEFESAGAVAVLYGSSNGLNQGTVKPRLVTRESLLRDVGVPPGPGSDRFGRALAAGDFNGDGVTELAVGAPGPGSTYLGGSVQTLAFNANGTVGLGSQLPISQNTDGVPGDDEENDDFGTALAAGDVDGDGRDDLAVGAPGENCPIEFCDELLGEGSVTLLRGSAKGLVGSNSQLWTQNSPGVGGTAREDDGFGYALAMGHLDSDKRADLAIGALSDWVGKVRFAGTVTVLLGRSSGLSTAGIGGTVFHQNTAGIGEKAEDGDRFGQTLATAPVQKSGQDNLIIGAPGESVGKLRGAGQIHVLEVSAKGPKAKGSQTLHLDSAGVTGKAVANAGFGEGLS